MGRRQAETDRGIATAKLHQVAGEIDETNILLSKKDEELSYSREQIRCMTAEVEETDTNSKSKLANMSAQLVVALRAKEQTESELAAITRKLQDAVAGAQQAVALRAEIQEL